MSVCMSVCQGVAPSYLSVCLKFLLCLSYFCYLFWLPFKFNLYLMFNSQILDRRRTRRRRMFDLILCDFFGLTRVKKCTMSDQVISSWIKYFLLPKCFCNIDIFILFFSAKYLILRKGAVGQENWIPVWLLKPRECFRLFAIYVLPFSASTFAQLVFKAFLQYP